MKFELSHIGIIFLLILVSIGLYHFGVFNLVYPGRKTVSKRTAKRFAKYVAETANQGSQNMANSSPPSLTGPVPLPLIDTWGAEDEKQAA